MSKYTKTSLPGPLYVEGVPILPSASSSTISGNVFYVGSETTGASDSNRSFTNESPASSVASALSRVVSGNGDVIFILPYHNETLTDSVALSTKTGYSIIGLGHGDGIATFTPDATGGAFSVFSLSSDDVIIDNVKFAAETSGNNITAQISIATGLKNPVIKNCLFEQGANDVESILFAGTCSNPEIYGNKWNILANGPDSAILATAGVISDPYIVSNIFDGGTTTNSWDNSAILSNQINTGIIIENNKFIIGAANKHGINLTAASEGIIEDNSFFGYTKGYGIDPGSCYTDSSNKVSSDADEVAISYTKFQELSGTMSVDESGAATVDITNATVDVVGVEDYEIAGIFIDTSNLTTNVIFNVSLKIDGTTTRVFDSTTITGGTTQAIKFDGFPQTQDFKLTATTPGGGAARNVPWLIVYK